MWGPDARDPLEVCRPIAIEVWRPEEAALQGWTEMGVAKYAGNNGLKPVRWADA